MKRRIRIWLFAIATLLLLASTYELLAIYETPPSYLSPSRMMLEGRLTISPDAQGVVPAEHRHAAVTLLIVAIYAPSLALLFFAIFFKRRNEVAR